MYIYVVYEDNHGDVSYWLSKRRAYKEARDIIMQDPYFEGEETKIERKEITNEQIENYYYCVGVRREKIGKSWR